ncbi:cysteine synthase [candidate division KSB1 bacterium RBG_16_48_16]|nr:MAG: cysteine synthase [candidate division KSB1 bacterium RBG_16_48_16]
MSAVPERQVDIELAEIGQSVIRLIGNTPLIKLRRISRQVWPVDIYAKAEWYNPGGSVKDRAALNMIRQGEKTGQLTRDKIILDATSGNTGVAYAMIGAALGYRVRLVMPENVGEFIKLKARAFGADIVASDAVESSDGAIRKARELAKNHPGRYFYPDQYNNDANWLAHYHGTGQEILRQTHGRVTHFYAGLGTSGTFTGVGRRLKEYNRNIQLFSVQPDSALHGIEGLKHLESAMVPGIYDPDLADQNIGVDTEEAQNAVKRVAKEEGLFIGISSGAVLAAALQKAAEVRDGIFVVIFPDGGARYSDQRFWE